MRKFLAVNARAVLLHIEAGTRFDLLAGVVNGPVIGRMRPTLMLCSAAALTEANVMNVPAINLHHIDLSSLVHLTNFCGSHFDRQRSLSAQSRHVR
jgi:hypothetical protein